MMRVLTNATPIGLLEQWATRSQERARHNAMAACTVLAARRLERDEVHAYVVERLAARTASPGVGAATLG